MHICLVTSKIPPTHCGVGDYTLQLATALQQAGLEVTILTGKDQQNASHTPVCIRNVLPGWQLRGMYHLLKEVRQLRPDCIMVQWVPFLYQRWGINIYLPMAAILLRLMGYYLQTMVHEPWVPFNCWQYFISGPIQRGLLILMILASGTVAVSTSSWTQMLQHLFFWRRKEIFWLPVGSNIPLVKASPTMREQLRNNLGISTQTLVLALFSPLGSGKGHDLIDSLWQQIGARDKSLQMVVIGATASEVSEVLPHLAGDKRITFVGYLAAQEVSLWLQIADIFLAPFTDGISTRRTSALAALAHSLPVVTTSGHLFDKELFAHSPLVITNYEPQAFSQAVWELIEDTTRRQQLGAAANLFFQQHFSWPVLVELILSHTITPPRTKYLQPSIK